MDFLQKFDSLPGRVQEMFASNEPRIALERACFLYDFFEDDVKNLTSFVSAIFLKELLLEQFPMKIMTTLKTSESISYGIAFEISKKIFIPLNEYFEDADVLMKKWNSLKEPNIISEERAWKRVLDIESWMLEGESEKKLKEAEDLNSSEHIYVENAMAKYERLADQVITKNEVRSQKTLELLRPSIKNWIADYHDKNGVGKHSPIDRGTYLFHSENGKVLTPVERQKVGIILKSLDEQTPLNIDPERQVVIFDNERNTNNQSSNVQSGNSNEEPKDIFELKINTTGKTLQRNPSIAADNIAPASSVNRMDVVNAARVKPTIEISSLPSEKKPTSISSEPMPTAGSISKIGSDDFNKKVVEKIESKDEVVSKFFADHKSSAPDAPVSVEKKPEVEFKNITFSPNFSAAPKKDEASAGFLNDKKILPAHIPIVPLRRQEEKPVEKQKEQIFSIPSSKPPMGSEHYNRAKEAVPVQEKTIVKPLDEKLASIIAGIKSETKENIIPETSTEIKKASADDTSVAAKINSQNLDSLSDEMLFKLYKEKRIQNKDASLAKAKPMGMHIGPMHSGNDNVKSKNVVDLKN